MRVSFEYLAVDLLGTLGRRMREIAQNFADGQLHVLSLLVGAVFRVDFFAGPAVPDRLFAADIEDVDRQCPLGVTADFGLGADPGAVVSASAPAHANGAVSRRIGLCADSIPGSERERHREVSLVRIADLTVSLSFQSGIDLVLDAVFPQRVYGLSGRLADEHRVIADPGPGFERGEFRFRVAVVLRLDRRSATGSKDCDG